MRSYLNPVQLYHNSRINNFRPKLRFQFEVGQFEVKTAQTPSELRKILGLRHKVFLEEGLGRTNTLQIDFDKFDLVADHILLINKISNEVIGTYRILSSDLVKSFYSSTEFTTESFLQMNSGLKLELGRACIHPAYRTGAAINLIWKGLGRYAALTSANYMFGCTSIKSPSKKMVFEMLNLLGPSYYESAFNIKPRLKYRFFKETQFIPKDFDPKDLIPPLLSSYVNAGAKVYGEPAYDRDFKCFDVFTCLNLKTLPEKYIRRYLEL